MYKKTALMGIVAFMIVFLLSLPALARDMRSDSRYDTRYDSRYDTETGYYSGNPYYYGRPDVTPRFQPYRHGYYPEDRHGTREYYPRSEYDRRYGREYYPDERYGRDYRMGEDPRYYYERPDVTPRFDPYRHGYYPDEPYGGRYYEDDYRFRERGTYYPEDNFRREYYRGDVTE